MFRVIPEKIEQFDPEKNTTIDYETLRSYYTIYNAFFKYSDRLELDPMVRMALDMRRNVCLPIRDIMYEIYQKIMKHRGTPTR